MVEISHSGHAQEFTPHAARSSINKIFYERGPMTSSENDKDIAELYKGLQSLSESAFPKKCSMCHREFHTAEDFVSQSLPVPSGSGLKASMDDDDRPIVELFRNCVCGSTLMDFFSERRDTSEAGLNRRRVFANIQAMLVKKGLSSSDARLEILKLMHGEQSPVIEKLGIRIGEKKVYNKEIQVSD